MLCDLVADGGDGRDQVRIIVGGDIVDGRDDIRIIKGRDGLDGRHHVRVVYQHLAVGDHRGEGVELRTDGVTGGEE